VVATFGLRRFRIPGFVDAKSAAKLYDNLAYYTKPYIAGRKPINFPQDYEVEKPPPPALPTEEILQRLKVFGVREDMLNPKGEDPDVYTLSRLVKQFQNEMHAACNALVRASAAADIVLSKMKIHIRASKAKEGEMVELANEVDRLKTLLTDGKIQTEASPRTQHGPHVEEVLGEAGEGDPVGGDPADFESLSGLADGETDTCDEAEGL
jgi:hypothetical protein